MTWITQILTLEDRRLFLQWLRIKLDMNCLQLEIGRDPVWVLVNTGPRPTSRRSAKRPHGHVIVVDVKIDDGKYTLGDHFIHCNGINSGTV